MNGKNTLLLNEYKGLKQEGQARRGSIRQYLISTGKLPGG